MHGAHMTIRQESREILASYHRERRYSFSVTVVALILVLAVMLLGNDLAVTSNIIDGYVADNVPK